MNGTRSSKEHAERPFLARWIRRLAVPIVLGWLLIVFAFNVAAPQLEEVGKQNAVSMTPKDAPSLQAMHNMGRLFHESDSESAVMILLEGQQPLGTTAHRFYDGLMRRLRADTRHVEHIQDFWGDPLTEAGAQSKDGNAAFVQVSLAGNIGETLANESIAAVRQIVADTPPPTGIKVYVTGPSALQADLQDSGTGSVAKITAFSFVVIVTMLLFFYRSIITVVLLLAMVGVQLLAARGIVAVLAYQHIIGLSTFATNLLVALAMAAGTDYAIFLIGRYQEARGAGTDREAAYYQMFHGTAHVVLGSGLTIAGAIYCLSFARMPYFQTLGVPCATGIITGVAVALTLGPAVITIGSRFGLFEPKRAMRVRVWRRIGTTIVRWPGPVLAASLTIAIIGLLALPGYRTSFDERRYIPKDVPASRGLQAADRHFSHANLNPEVLIIEADHDMRNSSDLLVLDKVAKAVFRVPGIARVQAITRPQGTPIEHTSIPYLMSMQAVPQLQNMKLMKDRMADMQKQADAMGQTLQTMKRMYALMTRLAGVTDQLVTDMGDLQGTIHEIRDKMADLDDSFRPIHSYAYWESHCFDIPVCWSVRSVFDALDSIDRMTDTMDKMVTGMHDMNALMPQMVAQFGPMITTMETMQHMMLTMHSTMSGMFSQMDEMSKNSTAMGKAFDEAKNDDSFYLPPEVFDNPDFKRALKMFFSPDGKAARMIITHHGDPAAPEGLSHIEPIKNAAIEAVKGTPLEDATISLGGMAAAYNEISAGSNYDLMIAGIASLCLIFLIMLLITRSLVASLVIVGTVALSLGASLGLSVIVWQYIVGIDFYWIVGAMAVIIMLAVGSDYNLLLVSRFKEEIPGGLKTGIIRSMGGTGSVVTTAGLVFAFTLGSLIISDLRMIGQVGTTIGLGLLFDTLVVRSFMTPAVATLLGRWFWWPQRVRLRPASQMLRPHGPRPAVRQLLARDDDDTAVTSESPSRSYK